MTNWQTLIAEAMWRHKDTPSNLISSTLSADEMLKLFQNDWGSPKAIPFCAWSTNRVYFPLEYDGMLSVGSASRNPDGIPLDPQ